MGSVFFVVGDRKSTRLNSSHGYISYAVFCLKKKKSTERGTRAPCLFLCPLRPRAPRPGPGSGRPRAASASATHGAHNPAEGWPAGRPTRAPPRQPESASALVLQHAAGVVERASDLLRGAATVVVFGYLDVRHVVVSPWLPAA